MKQITTEHRLIKNLKQRGHDRNEIMRILNINSKQYDNMLMSNEPTVRSNELVRNIRLVNELKRLDIEGKVLDNAKIHADFIGDKGAEGVSYYMGRNTSLLKEVKSGAFVDEDATGNIEINFSLNKKEN